MKKIKENFSNIVICLMEALVGILLLINPVGFTSGIIRVVGVVLILLGLISVMRYFRTDALIASAGQGLVKGLIAVAGGVFCIVQSKWFIGAFSVLTMLYGVAILIAGLFKLQLTVDMLRMKWSNWGWTALSAAVTLIVAVIILLNPFGSTLVLWTFTAVTLIIESVFDMISIIVSGSRDKEGMQ